MSEMTERWKKRPKYVRVIAMAVFGVIVAVLLGLIFGIAIQWLWNALMPYLFNLKEITYWQAVGIFILARFIFGCSFGGGEKNPKTAKDKRERMRGEKEDAEENRNWEYYDEWWESQGKKAFDDYAGKKKNGPQDGEGKA